MSCAFNPSICEAAKFQVGLELQKSGSYSFEDE